MDRTGAKAESAPLIRVSSSRGGEGCSESLPSGSWRLVSVLVFQVAIGVDSEASLRIWTLEASRGEPIASRPSDWQAAPMPLAPVGTGGTDPTPPARYGHAMAYDSQSGRLVLFGGGRSEERREGKRV